MTSFSALYYPYIEFQTPDVLTDGLLFWDRIGRITPTGYTPVGSEMVKTLIGELDFVRNHRPSQSAKEEIAKPFLALIHQHGDEIRKRYSVSDVFGAPAHLGTDKLSTALAYALLQYGLARQLPSDKDDGDVFVAAHPKIVGTYMTVLAKQMASSLQYTTLAEAEAEYLASIGQSVEEIARVFLDEPSLESSPTTPEQLETRLAFYALKTVLPKKPLPSVDRLIKFRKAHRDELTAFQEGIRTLIAKNPWVSDTDSREQLQEHLTDLYVKHVEPKQRDLKKAIRSHGIETVNGIISIRAGIPPAVTGLTNVAERIVSGVPLHSLIGLSNPISTEALIAGTAGGIALAVSSCMSAATKNIKAARKESMAAYLQDVEEDFSPTLSLTRAAATLRRFGLGV